MRSTPAPLHTMIDLLNHTSGFADNVFSSEFAIVAVFLIAMQTFCVDGTPQPSEFRLVFSTHTPDEL